jgi:DNA-binding NarL/FixJ family response regulator
VNYSFLLIGRETKTGWSAVLQQALSLSEDSGGRALPPDEPAVLHPVTEEEAVQEVTLNRYDLVIVDAGYVHDVPELIFQLRSRRPRLRVVVATASPTWQRAREALKAGAADYIRKSLDRELLRSRIKTVLELPPPSSWS